MACYGEGDAEGEVDGVGVSYVQWGLTMGWYATVDREVMCDEAGTMCNTVSCMARCE